MSDYCMCKPMGLHADLSALPYRLELKPDVRVIARHKGLIRPIGDYWRKSVAICADTDERHHTLGFVAWRKRDNHKFLLAYIGKTVYVCDCLPQTRKTSIPLIAELLSIPRNVRITLRDKTGVDGGNIVDRPRFRSTWVAGSFYEI